LLDIPIASRQMLPPAEKAVSADVYRQKISDDFLRFALQIKTNEYENVSRRRLSS